MSWQLCLHYRLPCQHASLWPQPPAAASCQAILCSPAKRPLAHPLLLAQVRAAAADSGWLNL